MTDPVGALVSFHYYAREDLDPLFETGAVIADSGAFSAHTLGSKITVKQYARWLDEHRGRFRFAFSLDVVFDPEGSYRQWRELADKHGHKTVPVLHYGEPAQALDRYATQGATLVGLGGIVVKPANRTLPWAAHVLRYARDKWPAIRFHGLGIDPRSRLARLPFYCYDSSAFTAAYRYARLGLTRPGTSRAITVPLDGKGVYQVGQLLRGTYGVDPKEVAVSTPDTRQTLARVAAKSVRVAVETRRTKVTVSPPEGLQGSGPIAYLADASPPTLIAGLRGALS